jgi:hypothetical protein
MSGNDAKWAELSSQNERVVLTAEPAGSASPALSASASAQSEWAELASQSERLVSDADPLFRLASPRRGGNGMRPVASL